MKPPGLLSLILGGFLTAGVFCGDTATGQETPAEKKPAPVSGEEKEIAASVSRISESRAQSDGRDPSGSTSIKVRFESPIENAELLRVELAAAKDSLGNDLIDPKKIVKEAVGRFRTSTAGQHEITLSLGMAAREAKSIANLTGTVVFHDPATAKKPITIEDFQKRPAEFIQNERLKDAGISFAYLDEATFDEKGSKLIVEKVFGKMAGSAEIDEETARAMTVPMKVMFQAESAFLFVIDDPKKQLIKVEGLDAGDESAGAGMESVSGLWMITGARGKAISKIRLHLRSEDAEVSRQFTLTEIPLP